MPTYADLMLGEAKKEKNPVLAQHAVVHLVFQERFEEAMKAVKIATSFHGRRTRRDGGTTPGE